MALKQNVLGFVGEKSPHLEGKFILYLSRIISSINKNAVYLISTWIDGWRLKQKENDTEKNTKWCDM